MYRQNTVQLSKYDYKIIFSYGLISKPIRRPSKHFSNDKYVSYKIFFQILYSSRIPKYN